MPRKRTVGNASKAPQVEAETLATVSQEPQGVQVAHAAIEETHRQVNTTNSTTKGESRIMALTSDQIQALLGQTRTKGAYLLMLNEFIASGEAGVCANEQWVAIRDKKATTISQGFKNAKDNKAAADGAEQVSVLTSDDKVYLINLKTAGVEAEEVEEVAA